MNLASFGDEDFRYWQHATETLRGDLSSLDAYESKDLIKDAIALAKRFYLQQNAILIVDEIAYLGSTSNQYGKLLEPLLAIIADKIRTLSSSGKKRQQAIWTIVPEFVAGSLTQDAKAVKKLKLCYVASHPDRSLNWNGQSISFDWELFRQIKANFEISEPLIVPNSDRICFIAPHWMPVGELSEIPKSRPNPTAVEQARGWQVDDGTMFVFGKDTRPKSVREQLESAYHASTDDPQTQTPMQSNPDLFEQLVDKVKHESQAELKSFVLWLSDRKGQEITYDQIKDNGAKSTNVKRNRETIDPFIRVAILQRLITVLPNGNWRVRDS